MKFVESYEGKAVTVTVTRVADDRWTGAAHFVDAGQNIVRVEAGEIQRRHHTFFSSEDDARTAALRSAATAIDRERATAVKT